MTQMQAQVTSEISPTETKNIVRTNMLKYINASQVGNIHTIEAHHSKIRKRF